MKRHLIRPALATLATLATLARWSAVIKRAGVRLD